MTRNLVLLFAATFLATTSIDLATTWVGVFHMGRLETNPYSDLSSVEGLIIPEIIVLFLGIAMVALGAHLMKTMLLAARREGFATFRKTVFSWKRCIALLIFLPILFALLRSVVVFSNTLILLTGSGLFVDEEFSLLSRNQFILIVCALILVRPTYYLIYRVCRASTP